MKKFGAFYSQKKGEMIKRSSAPMLRNYFRGIFGEIKQYNEWSSGFPFRSYANQYKYRIVYVDYDIEQ